MHVQGFTFIKCNFKHVVRWRQRTQRYINKKWAQLTNLNSKTAINTENCMKRPSELNYKSAFLRKLIREPLAQIVVNVLVYI